ncbi:PaaX family transcriptional regulator C-terminal domain-containing protein [uncultured Roseobacter sp.]|uniref:PaaX family transcriptional regulator C-terminal domain-containing protein n=1 Tax=uncultured Roseobacter sp. TaxID=114847 RepID=UPI002613BBE1|nr:PaaX family transcriptional regulator C-terminal domain-containing protein [uncultured Roseobacter sp.]
MPSEDLSLWISALAELGGQRVWSLLVSVFGDLARDEGASVDGPVLSDIMTAMGVRPEATRVALHRLRKDGWITSAKSGRISRHSLTAYGRKETIAASGRIYAKPADFTEDWQVIITDGTEARDHLRVAGFVQLSPRVYAGSATAKAPVGTLILTGDTVPDWAKNAILPERLIREYQALYTQLETISTAADPALDMPPLERAVLRCLLVHTWRRLLLRHPELPPALCPEGWKGHECRRLVTQLLTRISRPSLSELGAGR